jgi:hypothetical protein
LSHRDLYGILSSWLTLMGWGEVIEMYWIKKICHVGWWGQKGGYYLKAALWGFPLWRPSFKLTLWFSARGGFVTWSHSGNIWQCLETSLDVPFGELQSSSEWRPAILVNTLNVQDSQLLTSKTDPAQNVTHATLEKP